MICMTEEKIKRSYLLAGDVIEHFDVWIERTGMEKQIAVQLAMWVVMGLAPGERQRQMDLLRARAWPAEDALATPASDDTEGSSGSALVEAVGRNLAADEQVEEPRKAERRRRKA